MWQKCTKTSSHIPLKERRHFSSLLASDSPFIFLTSPSILETKLRPLRERRAPTHRLEIDRYVLPIIVNTLVPMSVIAVTL